MNVYEKLLQARVDLQSKNLKKSGNNKFAGYTYFELADFLPSINEICNMLKLIPVTHFTQEIATLEIINAEKPEEIIYFTSPMASATLKGCHDVQNLGAVETYERRYLFMLAFEIVESDALDKTQGSTPKSQDRNDKCVLSDAQLKRLWTLGSKAGFTSAQIESQISKKFGVGSVKELTKQQYDQVTTGYEKIITGGNK